MSNTPAIFEVPYPRNPYFSGRGAVLEDMRKVLTSDRPGAKRLALCGMGGVGKSQLALEYAHARRDDYQIVWWLSAEDQTSLGLGFAHLGARLGLRIAADASMDEIRHRVRRALDELDNWLLVFDNVQSPQDIRNHLPLRGAGHVLITSQVSEWNELGARTIRVRELSRPESVQFLVARTGKPDLQGHASKLAHTLGDLPLALEQAAAVIVQTDSSYESYLRRFETHWGELLQRGPLSPDHPDSLAMTLELSFRQVESESAASAHLLCLLAYFGAEHLDKVTLLEAPQGLPPSIVGLVGYRLEELLGALERYSLVEVTPGTVSMHRLVAALARQRLTPDERAMWASSAAQLLSAHLQFDGMNPSTWARCAQVLPHALAAAQHADKLGVAPQAVEWILSNAGRYLLKQMRLHEAQLLLERAVFLAQGLYGARHPRVSDAANNLGRVLQKLGDLASAAGHYELALSIDRDAYGQADPRVAAVSNNYGMCLLATGQHEEARYHLEWALAVYREHYGPEHPKVASVLNNLGCALRDLLDIDGARQTFDEALRAAEASTSAEHPTVANILYNLAVLHRGSAAYADAEDSIRKALAIDETCFGPGHPNVARDLAELANVLSASGNAAAAEQYSSRARSMLVDASNGSRRRGDALRDAMRTSA